jgi:hypothetical protein
VDDHRLFVGVAVEHDHLEESSGSVGSDDQGPPVACDQTDRIADGVGDVLVSDTVLAGAVRDLRETRKPCRVIASR